MDEPTIIDVKTELDNKGSLSLEGVDDMMKSLRSSITIALILLGNTHEDVRRLIADLSSLTLGDESSDNGRVPSCLRNG